MPNTGPDSTAAPLQVVAGALIRNTEVLLARRLPGAYLGGLWEFPGGKIEADEDAPTALRRELAEEIGIAEPVLTPLIRFPYQYPDFAMDFTVYRVAHWQGTPQPLLGQELRWVPLSALAAYATLPASRSVLHALRLPQSLAISPDMTEPTAWWAALERLLRSDMTLLQLRVPSLDVAAYRVCARDVVAQARKHNVTVLLNAPAIEVEACGAGGVHLNGTRLRATHTRPLPAHLWVSASCHSAEDLAHAATIGVDFVLLSAPGKGAAWARDFFTTQVAATALPAYAIGGLSAADCAAVVACGGQGVAAIRGFWPAH